MLDCLKAWARQPAEKSDFIIANAVLVISVLLILIWGGGIDA